MANHTTYPVVDPADADTLIIADKSDTTDGAQGTTKNTTILRVWNFFRAKILTLLGSTANGQGASLLGLEDSGNFFDGDDPEAALQQIGARLDDLGSAADLDETAFVKVDDQTFLPYDAGGDPNAIRPAHGAGLTVAWFNTGGVRPVNALQYDMVAGSGVGVVDFDTDTGASYNLTASNVGRPLRMDNASANTVNIQTNATEAIAIGAALVIRQVGAGTTTIAWPAGVTVNGAINSSMDVAAQYKSIALHKIGTDEFEAEGAIA